MTETQAVSIEDVRLLVAERQRYDDWMAALEAKRAETPARVFERVYGDYAERRTGVMERLREHVDTLASLGRDLESRLGALETRLASLEDERIEAMLRTAVGEFDDSRWEEIRREVEASIAEHTAQRETLLLEVDDVRTLLASASSEPPRSVLEERAPEEPASEPGDESLIDIGAAVDDASATAGAAPSLDDAFIAADALETVAPSVVVAESIVVTESLDTITPVESIAQDTAARDTAARESLEIDDALIVFSGEHASPALAAEPQGSGAATTGTQAPTSHAPPASVDSFDDLAFLRSVIDPPSGAPMSASASASAPLSGLGDAGVRVEAGAPQKTLRCTECGTMNLPTEWYCERCGGELAAF